MHTHTHRHTYTHTHIFTHTHAHTLTRTHTYTHTHTWHSASQASSAGDITCVTHTYDVFCHACTHTHTHIYTHTYAHTHTHTHLYTHTHTWHSASQASSAGDIMCLITTTSVALSISGPSDMCSNMRSNMEMSVIWDCSNVK